MAFSVTPTIGIDLNNTVTASEALRNGGVNVKHRLGQQCMADDGKLYVYARANATIAASTAVCTVSPTTFLATATGGAYTSPATAMATGDYGWFGKASV